MIDRKTKLIAIVAAVFFTTALCVFLWVLYAIVASGQELQTRLAAIEETNAKIQANNELASLLVSTQDERLQLEKYVLTEDETGIFLTDIEKLASSQAVALNTSSLEVVKTKDEPDKLQVEFEIKGRETDVKNMLALFESLPYHSIVSAFSLTRVGNGQVESSITLQITLLES